MNGKITRCLLGGNKMIRLIACDLDNTLLDEHHELNKEDALVIKQIQEQGIHFMVATGRSYEAVQELIGAMGIQCDYILLNGAMIMDKEGRIMQETPLPKGMRNELVTMLLEKDLCFHMYSDCGTITFDAQRGSREALHHMMKNGMTKKEAEQIIMMGKFGVYDKEYGSIEEFFAHDPKVYKFEMFLENLDQQEKLRHELMRFQGIEVTNSVVDNIEITSYDAQKGIALSHYCEKHHITKEEVLVFGDSLNDMNMISIFPNSFAVANATAAILEQANYHTASNVEHGVSLVLKEVLKHKEGNDFLKNFKKKGK